MIAYIFVLVFILLAFHHVNGSTYLRKIFACILKSTLYACSVFYVNGAPVFATLPTHIVNHLSHDSMNLGLKYIEHNR